MPMEEERTGEHSAGQKEECSTGTQSTQSAEQQGQGSQGTGKNGCCGNSVVAYPQDVVLAATSLALALSKGRSQYEIETLINLFSLTTNNLQAILAQILINKKVQDYLETPL
ncbi:MAG: hypothetical protein SOX80_00025 [Candidatus Fimivivens sp.]|jgi:hypothetical protein|nr:hypothetical protein [Oscillospiraceae bacterium]MDY3217712.1 hypothetical protein [Candidatus Fimivivens sp.]